ncbi:hypothetical protein GJA_3879 [Janthinobacterium agaricidamnosum NBRC 102515 = DSM 9628]|uniref:Uncharacterized protein n=1 Tax=Janthinobacterium agaricidamnosum NBRC 102515 = DSM 9628 TaxID=1349767 RepID=W0VA88_9BURK|nr:hypothetical protein GJA_3879 [Janthinobacterium agaricidamnosum NBRC 102515 = DSM 9628]
MCQCGLVHASRAYAGASRGTLIKKRLLNNAMCVKKYFLFALQSSAIY